MARPRAEKRRVKRKALDCLGACVSRIGRRERHPGWRRGKLGLGGSLLSVWRSSRKSGRKKGEEGKMESSSTLPVRSCYHVVPMTSISSPFSLFPEAANEGSKVQEATCIRAQDSGYTLEQPAIRLLPSSSNSGRAKTGSKELGVG